MLRLLARQNGAWSRGKLRSLDRTVSDTVIAPLRNYSTTQVLWEGEDGDADADAAAAAAAAKKIVAETDLKNKMAARDFNSRRADYKRQVSVLRKEYADEVAQQRAQDKAEQEARARELTRRRLERQRLKNIRSAENAMRQKAIREQTAREFDEHLRLMQIARDAKNERYAMARQLVIDELEEEAPLWVTSHDEVEAAFTPEAEQLLWARPGGVFGETNPSMDTSLWQYETHTWHMDRTYKSQRQILMEEIEEIAYNEANIDNTFWTPEKVEERRRLEEKARLRAMVHSAGRTELLKKQKNMLEEEFAIEEGDVPRQAPAPSHKMLSNDAALEREGSRLLMDDPTKFFVFDKSLEDEAVHGSTKRESDEESEAYAGPALGSPVALRDPLREGSHQNKVFPYAIGKIPKPDMRTEREKKQQEREERMWAASQLELASENIDIELAAEQQTAEDLEPPLNYDEHEWDSDEEEWNKGLDPETDARIMNTPREKRYKEDDLAWVVEELEGKVKHLEQQFSQDVEGLKQLAKSEIRASEDEAEEAEEGSLEAALLALSDKELYALTDLDERYTEDMSPEDFTAAAEGIPGLTEDQVKAIISRERD
jgi:hypothetical protein